MAPDCVASIHEELSRSGGTDVLRFDTEVIDGRGRTLAVNTRHPETENGVDFIYARLRGERNSYVVEYVFRREAFNVAGGFPDYPVAWCADDVAWYSFVGNGLIRTLRKGKVRWRASGLNITDANLRHQRAKLEAGSRFLRWVRQDVAPNDRGAARSADDWRLAEEMWWVGQVRHLMPLGPSMWLPVLRSSRGVWRRRGIARLTTLAAWNAIASLRALRGVGRRLLRSR
jgi:hypothetical protein